VNAQTQLTAATPRTDSMRLARNLGNIVCEDPLPASFSEKLELENAALVAALKVAVTQLDPHSDAIKQAREALSSVQSIKN